MKKWVQGERLEFIGWEIFNFPPIVAISYCGLASTFVRLLDFILAFLVQEETVLIGISVFIELDLRVPMYL